MENKENTTLPPVATNSHRSSFWILFTLLAFVSFVGCESNPLDPKLPERTAEEIMTERPFTSTNIDLFSPFFYPDAIAMQPAQGPAPSEVEVRNLLTDYANKDSNWTADEALARLNGRKDLKLGLLSINGNQPILPGSQFTNSSFASLIAPLGPKSTPRNKVLNQYLNAIQEAGKPVYLANAFYKVLITFMGQNNGNFSAEDGIAVAKAFQIDIVK